MLVCGLKVTHDGGVALIEDNALVASVEVEKLDNRYRYSELEWLPDVERVLAGFGRTAREVDSFVVDGWGYGEQDPTVHTTNEHGPVALRVAPYREERTADDSMRPHRFAGLPLGGVEHDYLSYHHTTGHLLSAYTASPFAQAGEPSFVLVWDGGVLPRCYYVTPDAPHVENLGPIFGLIGNVYPTFAMRFPPFRPEDLGGPPERAVFQKLSVPGKVMAYTALGEVREDLCAQFDWIYANRLEAAFDFADHFAQEFLERTRGTAYEPADAMASFQHWMGVQLVRALRALREREPGRAGNLCFAGGCALNIKWNSAIRASGVFDRFWVPPFPNDSGSALGAAATEMTRLTGRPVLDWSVYRGPRLSGPVADEAGWRQRPCELAELAKIMHEQDQPVVVLHGQAELGPRALGNRSIIAPPSGYDMKDRLNEIKRREGYRPVSPICLEHRAPEIFDPGTPDPYMLFEHQLRPEWRSRVPAIQHLDGSARLQTVTDQQSPVLARLLTEYAQLSGIPLLCNTSANHEGRGFFPDATAAMRWGRIPLVWSDGVLWEREESD